MKKRRTMASPTFSPIEENRLRALDKVVRGQEPGPTQNMFLEMFLSETIHLLPLLSVADEESDIAEPPGTQGSTSDEPTAESAGLGATGVPMVNWEDIKAEAKRKATAQAKWLARVLSVSAILAIIKGAVVLAPISYLESWQEPLRPWVGWAFVVFGVVFGAFGSILTLVGRTQGWVTPWFEKYHRRRLAYAVLNGLDAA